MIAKEAAWHLPAACSWIIVAIIGIVLHGADQRDDERDDLKARLSAACERLMSLEVEVQSPQQFSPDEFILWERFRAKLPESYTMLTEVACGYRRRT